MTQRKPKPLTSGPTGPWKPVAPFRPDIPWERSQEQGVSEVPTPRQQLPLSHCVQEGQGEHRDLEGFAQSQEKVGWSQGWSWDRHRKAKVSAQERGGREGAITRHPVNSREAQQDLVGHFLPSPPGKAKSSLSDGGQCDLGPRQGGSNLLPDPGRAAKSQDRHPHLRSLLSFLPNRSRVTRETLKREQQGRVSPSWTVRS